MKKRSIMLAIVTLLATAYTVYLFCYFVGGTLSTSGSEAIGGAIATALVLPHAVMFLIGAVFGWIGYLLKQSWAALVAAILYSVGTLFFLAYFMFGAPLLIMGFIGYANQKKLNKRNKETNTTETVE